VLKIELLHRYCSVLTFLKPRENFLSCVRCFSLLTSLPLHPLARMDQAKYQPCVYSALMNYEAHSGVTAASATDIQKK
jgi:hypothetical protein